MSENWENRTLFHGENLDFLRAMNSETVDLIATDPPFNKGHTFEASPDSLAKGASFDDRWSWEKDVHQSWVDQITDDFPKVMNVIEGSRLSYGDDMGAFLCFMAVRLLAMHRILKDTGSIYLHCDPTASHYLKELMDAIFGRKNFRNEIIWYYKFNAMSSAKTIFPRKHDNILFYSKSKKYTFNIQREEKMSEQHWKRWGKYSNENKDVLYGKIKHQPGTVKIFKPMIEKRLGREIKDTDVIFKIENSLVKSVWDDIVPVKNSLKSKESTGYPTQKPVALYERIIRASSNEGDIILDPFAGCATTCVAAEKLKRKWVGIDSWNKAHDIVLDRVKTECGLVYVNYETIIPKRTDDGQTVVPFLKTVQKVLEPKDDVMSRSEMLEFLIKKSGFKCQGCNRAFDDSRYLELDHNTPRADGGINHISNRILLCSPCNKLKSHKLTLSGLKMENKKRGYMK